VTAISRELYCLGAGCHEVNDPLFGQDGGVRALPVILVGCTGCTGASLFDMTVTYEPVAIGAVALGQLQSRTCTEADCDFATVKIRSMDVTPPGIFDVPQRFTRADNFQLLALTEGTATLTVTGDDGEDTRTFTRDLTAVAANRVTGVLSHEGFACATPVRYGPGLTIEMPFDVWRDDAKLYSYGLVPFVAAGAEIDLDLSQSGNLTLRLPATTATVSITSTLDPSFAVSLEVIAPTAIDGITLSGPDEPLQILDAAALTVEVTAGGAVVCADNISRTATTQTPDVCKIRGPNLENEWTSPGMHTITVAGIHSGTCTITVTNAITGPSATTSFEVTM
jgi:hypothetical protein